MILRSPPKETLPRPTSSFSSSSSSFPPPPPPPPSSSSSASQGFACTPSQHLYRVPASAISTSRKLLHSCSSSPALPSSTIKPKEFSRYLEVFKSPSLKAKTAKKSMTLISREKKTKTCYPLPPTVTTSDTELSAQRAIAEKKPHQTKEVDSNKTKHSEKSCSFSNLKDIKQKTLHERGNSPQLNLSTQGVEKKNSQFNSTAAKEQEVSSPEATGLFNADSIVNPFLPRQKKLQRTPPEKYCAENNRDQALNPTNDTDKTEIETSEPASDTKKQRNIDSSEETTKEMIAEYEIAENTTLTETMDCEHNSKEESSISKDVKLTALEVTKSIDMPNSTQAAVTLVGGCSTSRKDSFSNSPSEFNSPKKLPDEATTMKNLISNSYAALDLPGKSEKRSMEEKTTERIKSDICNIGRNSESEQSAVENNSDPVQLYAKKLCKNFGIDESFAEPDCSSSIVESQETPDQIDANVSIQTEEVKTISTGVATSPGAFKVVDSDVISKMEAENALQSLRNDYSYKERHLQLQLLLRQYHCNILEQEKMDLELEIRDRTSEGIEREISLWRAQKRESSKCSVGTMTLPSECNAAKEKQPVSSNSISSSRGEDQSSQSLLQEDDKSVSLALDFSNISSDSCALCEGQSMSDVAGQDPSPPPLQSCDPHSDLVECSEHTPSDHDKSDEGDDDESVAVSGGMKFRPLSALVRVRVPPVEQPETESKMTNTNKNRTTEKTKTRKGQVQGGGEEQAEVKPVKKRKGKREKGCHTTATADIATSGHTATADIATSGHTATADIATSGNKKRRRGQQRDDPHHDRHPPQPPVSSSSSGSPQQSSKKSKALAALLAFLSAPAKTISTSSTSTTSDKKKSSSSSTTRHKPSKQTTSTSNNKKKTTGNKKKSTSSLISGESKLEKRAGSSSEKGESKEQPDNGFKRFCCFTRSSVEQLLQQNSHHREGLAQAEEVGGMLERMWGVMTEEEKLQWQVSSPSSPSSPPPQLEDLSPPPSQPVELPEEVAKDKQKPNKENAKNGLNRQSSKEIKPLAVLTPHKQVPTKTKTRKRSAGRAQEELQGFIPSKKLIKKTPLASASDAKGSLYPSQGIVYPRVSALRGRMKAVIPKLKSRA